MVYVWRAREVCCSPDAAAPTADVIAVAMDSALDVTTLTADPTSDVATLTADSAFDVTTLIADSAWDVRLLSADAAADVSVENAAEARIECPICYIFWADVPPPTLEVRSSKKPRLS